MVDSGSLLAGGRQHLNIMHRVWESGSALLQAISSKIRSISAKSGEQHETADADPKLIDSLKIQIALHSQQLELSSLRRIAETSMEPEIASCAVSHLCEHEPEMMLPELKHLAMSYSFACLPALISLFNNGEVELAQSILMERLGNGDYFYLIENRKARALLLLDVLGAVDEFCQSNLCFEHFPTVWKCLANRPDDQIKLLAEILGDLNPDGLRYSPDNNMIPHEVKLQALQILHALQPPGYQRSLWYASRDQDDALACTATMACMELWQNEGAVPERLEPFAMLNLNLLFYLSKVASTFQWRGPRGAMQIFQSWCADLEVFESMDAKADPRAYAIKKKQLEKVREELLEISKKRLNALQPIVDAVTNSLGLPHAKIRSTDVPGVAAAYLVGTGTVEFSNSTLLDDKPLTEEFMSSMLHELNHMEQDVLIIKMICDDLNVKFGEHAAKLNQLFQRYADAIGYAPDSIFLLEVLRLRRDKPLTAAERRRAERLFAAAYDNLSSSQTMVQISDRIERLQESFAAIESGAYDFKLIDCLRDERSLRLLFQDGHIPAALLNELRLSRARLDSLIASLQEIDHGGALQKLFKRKDSISIAQELLSCGDEEASSQLAPLLERFRTALAHMLKEEYLRLEKKLSELRRAGYHEDEAYAISDRVEVIVKALRKGWYEFSS